MKALLTSLEPWLIILIIAVIFGITFTACLCIWLECKNEKTALDREQQSANLRYIMRRLQE